MKSFIHKYYQSSFSLGERQEIEVFTTFGGKAVFSARNLLKLEIYDESLSSELRLSNKVKDSITIINVYPNPANQLIRITANVSLENYQVSIGDISGRIVMQTVYKNELNVAQLESGLYNIDLENDLGQHYKSKLIIAK